MSLSDLSHIFTYENFADGVAGASGGISAISLFYPLNIIRTKLQTDDPLLKRGISDVVEEIMRSKEKGGGGGFGAFYKGWKGQVIALGCSNFVYFYSYNCLKVIIQKRNKATIGPIENLAVGAVAGVINVLLTTPLWAVSTRLAVQAKRGVKSGTVPYKGMIDGLMKMHEREGLIGMWKSVVPNLILVSNPTIHFFTYERARIRMAAIAAARGSPLTSLEFFLMGAFAKMVATFLTYPLQVVQSQLRNDSKKASGKQKYNGTLDCLLKVYKIAGWGGLFRGLFAKLWQTVLTAAFQFMTFEKMRIWVRYAMLMLAGKQALMLKLQ